MRAVLVLCLMLAGCSSAAPDDTGIQGAAPGASIRGLVVDDAVMPVGGAVVHLHGMGQETTASDGAFQFDGLAPGTYRLNVSASGFVDQQVDAVADVDGPLVKIALERVVPSTAGAVYAYVEGYVGCSVHIASFVQDDVCSDIDPDVRVPLRFGEAKVPSWLQVEVDWDATQAFGQRLSIIPGVAGSRLGNVWGESPLTCRVATDAPCDNADDTGGGGSGLQSILWNDEVDVVVYADCFAQCVPGTAVGAGIALQQEYHVYGTAFYQMDPRDGWTFIGDGEHPV